MAVPFPTKRLGFETKFSSVHANVHNHFNQGHHLVDRQTYRDRRSAAFAEWQASWPNPFHSKPHLRQSDTSCD